MRPGGIRYGLLTNESGGILDDVLVYHLADAAGASYYLMVVNASNRIKILDWVAQRLAERQNVQLTDVTDDWSMIAVQGPRALEMVQPLIGDSPVLAAMKYYTGLETTVAGFAGIVSRTGYTGEDGCELMVGAPVVERIWNSLADAGATPAGLGSRDTLRLEAAMPLYGHELSETINPYQAGLDFAVDLEGRSFPGRDSLARLRNDVSQPRRVGLTTSGKRVPREGCPILLGERTVGQITSGTFSPTLDQPIAMGYIEPALSVESTNVAIDVRGRTEHARVVQLPFYRRKSSTGSAS
jgi:aminomethyltransferase